MEIGSREWQNLIIDGAQQLGIAIDERISDAFSTYAAELIHWNRKINLTAITDPRDMAIKHFLDSLAPAKFVPERARLLDIGSGAGFPGIPLKILKPSLSILLIDGVRKKVSFLKHMIRTLNLDQSNALHIRAENLPHHPVCAGGFSAIISRAVSDLTSFIKMAMPLLAKQGVMIAMKAKIDPKTLGALRAEMSPHQFRLDVEHYSLPIDPKQRAVVLLKSLDE